MFPKNKALLLFFFLLGAFELSAQNIYWNKVLEVDSVSFITSIENDGNGKFDLAYTRNAGTLSNAFGDSRISQYNSDGSHDWTLDILGNSRITDLKYFNNSIYFVGDGQNALLIDQYNVPANSFFLGKLSSNGAVDWVVSTDTLDSYHSKMAIDQNGNILVTIEASFRNSYILRFDSNGVLNHIEYLPEIILSDICLDDNDNIYVSGMALGASNIDSLNINPPGTYINSVLKFDSNLNAKWINYSEYITFDYHQRVIYWNNRIMTYNRAINNLGSLRGTLITYNLNGNELNRRDINSVQLIPNLEFAKSKNKLGLIYEAFNFSNPSVDDTLKIEIYDDAFVKITEHSLIGQVPVDFFGNRLFNLSFDSCSAIVTCSFTSNEMYFDNVSTSSLYPKNNHLLVNFNSCPLFIAFENETEKDLTLYPNPFKDQFYLDIKVDGNWKLEILNLTGLKIYESRNLNFGLNKIQIQDLKPGLYFVHLSNTSNSEILYKRIIKN